ncbi:MAG TPA: CinA family protein [Anaerolineales bacterium]|nr:CinA family protein [Anaerolineales bacterium]
MGTKTTELPETIIGNRLREQRLKLATAESCTGGLIGHRITNIPGSSDYYLGGVVAYAYEAKTALLGVPASLLAQFGAVSRQTVLEMAAGARKALNADLAISVSGIAGPGGGLPNKPIGTVWVGLAAPDGSWARCFHFPGDREQNKASAAEAALQILLEYLTGNRQLEDGQQ